MVEMKNNIRLEVTAGDTVAWNVKLYNITENLRLAYFTVKENPDDDAIIQKTLGAGVTLVDDRAYRDQKTYKIQLQSEDTAGLSPDLQYMYDLKVAIGNVVKTIISGVLVVRESVTSPTQIIINDAEVQAVDLITAELETAEPTAGIEYEQDPVANEKIGNMENLNTTQKSTIVGAINEVNTKASNTKEDVDKIIDGTIIVPNATNATHATNADNSTNATNATNATSAESATNVTSKINNKNISDIFENNGTTVKNATNATNATNADITDFTNNNEFNLISANDYAIFGNKRTYQVRVKTTNYQNYIYAIIFADSSCVIDLATVGSATYRLTLSSNGVSYSASATFEAIGQSAQSISFEYRELR